MQIRGTTRETVTTNQHPPKISAECRRRTHQQKNPIVVPIFGSPTAYRQPPTVHRGPTDPVPEAWALEPGLAHAARKPGAGGSTRFLSDSIGSVKVSSEWEGGAVDAILLLEWDEENFRPLERGGL